MLTTPENIRMSLFGSAFVARSAELLAVDGQCVDIGFRPGAYLFLAGAQGLATLQANHRTQREQGADVLLLDAAQLRERFGWLRTEGVLGGSLGLSGLNLDQGREVKE